MARLRDGIPIRYRFLAGLVGVGLLASAAHFVILSHVRRTALRRESEARLMTAAECARAVVGSDYHDRIMPPEGEAVGDPVTPAEFARHVSAFDALCRRLNLQYLWSVMLLDGRVVFTTATHSNPSDPNSPCASFLEPHTDPNAFDTALATREPTYSTFVNRWGKGGMVLIPATDRHGRTHLFGASLRLEPLGEAVRQTIVEAVLITLTVAVVAVLISLALARSLSRPIVALTRAAERMAGGDLNTELPPGASAEMAALSSSLDTMRRAIRRQMDELQQSEQRFRAMFEQAAAGVAQVDAETLRFVRVNRRYCEITGLDPDRATETAFTEITHPDDVAEDLANVRRMRAGEVREVSRQKRYVRPDGSVAWVDLSVAAMRGHDGGLRSMIVVIEDITARRQGEQERRHLAEQLRQATKMEAVGRLAGGVAHDFNNLLTPILGYAQLALESIGEDHRLRGDLLEIQRAAKRANDLTGQLLAFGRKQVLNMEPLDLNRLIRDEQGLLRRLTREDVELTLDLAEDIGTVRADASQLSQVLVNLVANAADAMPDGGRLTIETAEVHLDRDYARAHPDSRPGPHVMLAVSDTGRGMDEETLDKIFEPFFTTKDDNRGTGLGLASVHGIVRQHGGSVSATSEPGRGTTLKIYLPRTGDAPAPPAPAPATGERRRGGSETVLVVEDNPAVRDFAAAALRKKGYHVLTAAWPGEALDIARGQDRPIDLMLSDVVMPGMDGVQLHQALAEFQPDCRVLYMSGYTGNVLARHGVLAGGVHFIPKPFGADALAEKVRDVLDADEPTRPGRP